LETLDELRDGADHELDVIDISLGDAGWHISNRNWLLHGLEVAQRLEVRAVLPLDERSVENVDLLDLTKSFLSDPLFLVLLIVVQ
jgi:hypothetical protein